MNEKIDSYTSELIETIDALDEDKIIEAAELIAECPGIIWIFGNGHAASVAEAFALDLVKHAEVRAVALNSTAMITAYANDDSYEQVFGNIIDAIPQIGDVLIGITFSGSDNILIALSHWVGLAFILIS